MLSRYYKVLREAARIDIFDVAFEFSSESLNLLSLEPTNLPRKGVLKRISLFFWHFLKSTTESKRRTGPKIASDSFVFFAMNQNEKQSMATVVAKLPRAYWIGFGDNAANSISFFLAHLVACIYSPFVLMKFLRSRGYKRLSFSYIFDNYLMVYGLYVVARLWYQRIKPKALILANDINTYARIMLHAARDEGVTTFYLQHASVPENFPPLSFDYALLEGDHALRTHSGFGETRTQVFLVGMPRHDPYFPHINRQSSIAVLGICTNGLDPMGRADELLWRVRQEFPDLTLVLRPHAADFRKREWKQLSQAYGMDFSEGSRETSFEFLCRVDAIIAGESNILLEAAVMGVLPLYYDFARTNLDWYRFLRNGLVEYASDPEELCDTIENNLRARPFVRPKAKQYCATIDTCFDGRSSEVASNLIQLCTSANRDVLNGWKRISGVKIEAYELRCNQDSI